MLTAHSDTSLPKAPLRIGLVGCGRLAEFGYIPALRRASGIALAGVVEVDFDRCKRIAPWVPAYASLQELIDHAQVQAVIISTPTRCHLADATIAARAKLPALVEKPPGRDVKEAQGLLELVPEPSLGFNRRFDPGLRRLKDRLSKHEVYDLRLELSYRRKAWNPIDMQDDALLDLGPHLIDLVRWLTANEVVSVTTATLTQHYVRCHLELERGQATIICCCNRPYREAVRVRAKDGRALATYTRGGILAGLVGRLLPERESPLIRSLTGQLEAFTAAVQGLQPGEPLGSAADGVKVMNVIEAVRTSAALGGSRCPVRSLDAG